MAEHLIKADISKNRLYIVLKGFFYDDEMLSVVDKIISEAEKLQPKFNVINDISDFKPTGQAGAAEIYRAHKEIIKMGVGKIIRIVDRKEDLNLANKQFERTSRMAGFEAIVVNSFQDAELELEQ